MKRLTNFNKFTLALVFALIGVISWGQEPTPDISGTGTELDPYVINTVTGWNTFANPAYYATYWASGVYVQLGANITTGMIDDSEHPGKMIGTIDHPFQGIFDGGNNTLTFYCNTPDEYETAIAPFQYTKNATIKNLTVNGKIHLQNGNAAGLIGTNDNEGCPDSNTTVENVVVAAEVNNYNYSYENAACGGFASDGSGVRFTNCVYRGYFASYSYGGGFCHTGNAKTKFNHCLFAPTKSRYFGNSFVFYGEIPSLNFTDCYFTAYDDEMSASQGEFVYLVADLNDIIGRKIAEILGFEVCEEVTVVISNVDDEYSYTNLPVTITPSVTFNGSVATINTHYTYTLTDSYGATISGAVEDIGDYDLTIIGVNDNDYYGSKSKSFSVVSNEYGDWSELQGFLNAGGEIVLHKNYRDDDGEGTLVINKDVTLDLNGYTIDRNLSSATSYGHVIRINSGKTVNITGPGVITGGYNLETSDYKDGGGIYNKGNLTLNQVTISGNKCVKQNQTSTSATARGGGIYTGQGGSLYINGCLIRDNEAQGGAGAVFSYKAANFIVDKYGSGENAIVTKIRNNTSKDKGGGIRVDNENNVGTVTLSDCEICYNVLTNSSANSAANGGAIHLDKGTMNLIRCNIHHNKSSKFGGGLYLLDRNCVANLTDCTINYNQSYDEDRLFNSRGGGIYIYAGTLLMNGGVIYDNSSNLAYGGGVFVNNGGVFRVQGNLRIYGNWEFINESGQYRTTNVYIAGKSDKINIVGDISSALIGVAKNGGTGVFTTGLNGNGTTDNFTSDDSAYEISSKDNEAELTTPKPFTPPSGHVDEYTINNTVYINQTITNIDKIILGDNGKIIVVEEGYLETEIENNDPTKIVIDGGQFVPTNSGVMATMRKDIHYAMTTGTGSYWYLISSGINNPDVVSNTNLILLADEYPEYDLYRFNESVALQWENYRNTEHVDFTMLQNGRGYLYRNQNDYTITISGTLNTGDIITPTLTCTAKIGNDDNIFKGFNIIGNPYPHNIKKGAAGNAIVNGDLLEDNYYRLLEDGTWNLGTDGDIIPPFEGIMVQAKSNSTLTINNVAVDPSSKGEIVREAANDNIWFTISNNRFEDRTCVEFKKGHGLNKIPHQNENAPMLYINYNGEDFASVDMSKDVKSINLNFDAKTTGYYTLSMKSDGEFDYIHLIDRLTGDDIDMLQEEEYTFIGSASDNADRFLVKLSPSTGSGTGSEAFAWQNGNDIIVNGNGELLVFDVMGRMVATRHINGVQTINLTQTGVYIFRLEGKTQKIIVR